MKVYKLRREYDDQGNHKYKMMEPYGADPNLLETWTFDCIPKATKWGDERLVEFEDSQRPASNFPWLSSGALGMDPVTLNRLSDVLGDREEFLPVRTLGGRPYILFNPLPCADCIDEDRSEWKPLLDRPRHRIVRFEFLSNRIPDFSIFKTTSNPFEILVTEGRLPRNKEFKSAYEDLGLRGLRFREIWNDEGNPVEPLSIYDI